MVSNTQLLPEGGNLHLSSESEGRGDKLWGGMGVQWDEKPLKGGRRKPLDKPDEVEVLGVWVRAESCALVVLGTKSPPDTESQAGHPPSLHLFNLFISKHYLGWKDHLSPVDQA